MPKGRTSLVLNGHVTALLLTWTAISAAFGPSQMLRPASQLGGGVLRRSVARFGGSLATGSRGMGLRAGPTGRCRGFFLRMAVWGGIEQYGMPLREKSGNGKKVLVAGGAGYIGSHLSTDLLFNGYEVIVLDNFMNSSPAALKRVEMLTGKKIKVYEADTRDFQSVMRVFETEALTKPIDTVVHLAGLKAVGESVEKPHLYYDNNVVGSLNLVRAMAEVGCKKLVFSSSATVYGDARSSPIKECHPLSATSPYGRSKLYVEEMLRDTVAADDDWSVAILRYFNPVGAHPSGLIGEDPKGIPNNLMPYITKVALGKQPHLKVFGSDYPTKDGTGVRDYIHICDLSSGHLAAIEKVDVLKGSEVYNLGTGRGISVLEMVEQFKHSSKADVPYEIVGRRKGDVAICYADPSKAEEGLGWTATKGLEEMCQDLWRWTDRNPDGYANDVLEPLEPLCAPTVQHECAHAVGEGHLAHVVDEAHSAQVPTQHKIHTHIVRSHV